MKGFKVEIDQDLTSYESSDEIYGSWSKSLRNEFVKVEEVTEYPDVVTTLDINKGDEAFVVWAEWSTGNSFGRAHNSNAEAVGIFKDEKAADDFAKFLEATENLEMFHFSHRSISEVVKHLGENKKLLTFFERMELVIDADDKTSNPQKIVEFTALDGQVFTFHYFAWVGYFDSLESVNVDKATIQ